MRPPIDIRSTGYGSDEGSCKVEEARRESAGARSAAGFCTQGQDGGKKSRMIADMSAERFIRREAELFILDRSAGT